MNDSNPLINFPVKEFHSRLREERYRDRDKESPKPDNLMMVLLLLILESRDMAKYGVNSKYAKLADLINEHPDVPPYQIIKDFLN